MYLEIFKLEETFYLRFKTLNGNRKSMTQGIRSHTLTWKHLKAKLQQDGCR